MAVVAALFPSFLCRAGAGVLLAGLARMIWQRRLALRQGVEAQIRLCRSVLYYVPFLTGANLIWMGLPVPAAEGMAKACADCAFLFASSLLLAAVYVYNLNTIARPIETSTKTWMVFAAKGAGRK